jgi:hypothetical protein
MYHETRVNLTQEVWVRLKPEYLGKIATPFYSWYKLGGVRQTPEKMVDEELQKFADSNFKSRASSEQRSDLVLTIEQAETIYKVLEQLGKADKNDRQEFVQAHTNTRCPTTEYRFCGMFGFGGKFRNIKTQWFVSYSEKDHTGERAFAASVINQELDYWYQHWFRG